jgi:two-component system alkaline phosphatase synthesis response regulator PhoP
MQASVLIVEDEEDIRELVSYNLLRDGYHVATVCTGEEALVAVEKRRPDLVVLDLMLPGIDGLSVCRRLKSGASTKEIPIVMVTAKGEEGDVVAGLNLGADDYITKPFSPSVLMARIQAVLRRALARQSGGSQPGDPEMIRVRNIVIHPGRHELLVDGLPVELTSTEFRVLQFLARRPGWVFTRQAILDGVHGDNYAITERAVDVQIVGLRKKLGTAGEMIETVRGVGYRFKE